MSKPAKTHVAAAKHLLRYLAEPPEVASTYTIEGFKLTVISDAKWSNNAGNGLSTSSHVLKLVNAPIQLQRRTPKSHSPVYRAGGGARCSGAGMKEAVFLLKHDAGTRLPSTLRQWGGAHRQHGSTTRRCERHVQRAQKMRAIRCFSMRGLVKQGKFTLRCVTTEKQITDIGTKHRNKLRHRYLVGLIIHYFGNPSSRVRERGSGCARVCVLRKLTVVTAKKTRARICSIRNKF